MDPPEIDLGELQEGTHRIVELTLTNTSHLPVTLGTWRIGCACTGIYTDPDGDPLETETLAVPLGPGEAFRLFVRIDAPHKSVNSSIAFITNEEEPHDYVWNAYVRGYHAFTMTPVETISPQLRPGDSVPVSFRVTSRGNKPFTVTSIPEDFALRQLWDDSQSMVTITGNMPVELSGLFYKELEFSFENEDGETQTAYHRVTAQVLGNLEATPSIMVISLNGSSSVKLVKHSDEVEVQSVEITESTVPEEFVAAYLEGDVVKLQIAPGAPKGVARGRLIVKSKGAEDLPIDFTGLIR
jgi:hypothetical protein